jgi:hypothetical protein
MYRNAGLIVSCASCGVEQVSTRMALGPLGGHQCWKCQLRAQIAEHRLMPRRVPVITLVAAALAFVWVLLAIR